MSLLLGDAVLLLLMVITLHSGSKKLSVNGLTICKSTTLQDENGIILHWAQTPINSDRPSIPMCIDEDDNLLERRCMNNGLWEEFDLKRCTFYTLKQFNPCPDGMEKLKLDNEEICLLVTIPTKWENICLKYGETKSILELSKSKLNGLMNHLKVAKQVIEFWSPAKRFQDYNPFQWFIVGQKWGDIVDYRADGLEIVDNYKDTCLMLKIKGEKLEYASENCARLLPEVCIFGENSALQMSCETGLTSKNIFNQDKCFTIERTFDSKKSLFQVTRRSHSKSFIKSLMESFDVESNERCLVDFGAEDYSTNYFTNTSFGKFSVIDGNGKWSMAETYSCVVYEEQVADILPEISLKYDSVTEKMLMIIYSQEFLWREDFEESGAKCFTIADNELVKSVKIKSRLWSETIKKFDVKLFDSNNSHNGIKKSIYEIKLYGKGPGIYWCEGVAVKSGRLVKSKHVIVKKKLENIVFAATLKSKVSLLNELIYDKKILTSLSDKLLNRLKTSTKLNAFDKILVDCITDIRVMKVVNFDKVRSELTAIYHITIMKDQDDSSSSEEYEDFMDKYASKFGDAKVVVNHHLMTYLENILAIATPPDFTFQFINSTEFCLPESIQNPNSAIDELVWEQALIGQTLPPTELCVYKSGMPLTRKCEGDFLNGGKWEFLSEQKLQCEDQEALSLHTKRLFAFNKALNPNDTKSILENITSITTHYDQLIPADLFYVSQAVQQITNVANFTASLNSMDLDYKYNLTIILNNIMNVNESFIQLSQLKLNTTNILLDSYDNLINSLATNYSIHSLINNNLISNSLNETDGTFIMRTEKIIVFICDPGRMNVSGVALIRNQRTTEDVYESSLNEYEIEKLYSTQTIDDVLNIHRDTLEIASFFPEELLNRIDEIQQLSTNVTNQTTNPLTFVIKIYLSDAIFKERSEVYYYKSQSKIISVSIPGHDQNLPLLLPIMMRKSNDREQSPEDVCGYWEFQPTGVSSETSEWLEEGCQFLGVSKYDRKLALCGCSHMTHFAYLIMGTYYHDTPVSDNVVITQLTAHTNALNVITILGSTLSILGILGIFITAVHFRTWREKASTKVLLQLSLAIALQMILISSFSSEVHQKSLDTITEKRLCIALGTNLHYFVLVTFSWMMIAAFLQFKRYVIVLGNLKPERFLLKSFIVGWVMPIVPIATVLIIDPFLYIPEIFGICYPQGLAFYFSVLLPVGIIVAANLVIFIIVIYNILKGGWTSSGTFRKNEHSMALSQLRVSIFLFFLLGLTWIFGLLQATSQETVLFSYLFCLTATLQGFVLFLYFILMDPITRKLWRESFRSLKHKF